MRNDVDSSSNSALRTPHSELESQSEICNQKSEIETAAIAALTTEHSTNPKRYFRRVAEIGIQLAEALHHAHEHGILHRDVKPANILLDAGGKAYITDFGLARIGTDASMTLTGDLVGTLRYMSPEQASGSLAGLDHRTDIYSLGAALYELALMRPVFTGTDQRALLRRIADEEPPRPSRLCLDIPFELDTILLTTLAKERADRYASAQHLADDLRRFLNHEPLHARRPSTAARARKWGRRHPSLVASALIALAVSVVASLAAFAIARSEQQKTARALAAKSDALSRAEAARRRAAANFQLALDTVDGFYRDVAVRWIADESALSTLQQDFLVRAAQFYERLARQPQVGLDQRLYAGSAYARIGLIEHHLQNYAAAVRARQEAIVIGKRIVAENPNVPAARAGLADRYLEVAESLTELARFDEAVEAYARGQVLVRGLISELPDADEHRIRLIRYNIGRAKLHNRCLAPRVETTAKRGQRQQRLQYHPNRDRRPNHDRFASRQTRFLRCRVLRPPRLRYDQRASRGKAPNGVRRDRRSAG